MCISSYDKQLSTDVCKEHDTRRCSNYKHCDSHKKSDYAGRMKQEKNRVAPVHDMHKVSSLYLPDTRHMEVSLKSGISQCLFVARLHFLPTKLTRNFVTKTPHKFIALSYTQSHFYENSFLVANEVSRIVFSPVDSRVHRHHLSKCLSERLNKTVAISDGTICVCQTPIDNIPIMSKRKHICC